MSEEALLARAGHLSHAPDAISVELAIGADEWLRPADKRFLVESYRRMTAERAEPAKTEPAAPGSGD